MHRAHDVPRALARAKRFIFIQWGNKRKKMQQNKQIKCMLKSASESE